MLRTDAHLPSQLGGIRTQIKDRAALVHIHSGPHIRIRIPEHLLVRTVKDIAPEGAFRLGVRLLLPVIIRKFRHGHVYELSLFLKISIISASVGIGFEQQLVRRLPAAHLVHPAGTYKHHIVRVAVVVLFLGAVLVDQVIQVRILPGLGIIDHAPQYILRMRPEVGAVSVIAGQQIP